MADTKIENIDSRNTIYNTLKKQILSLELPPGEMLSENLLAAHFDVSRVLVRDSLARLIEEGYIVVYPQKGSVVTRIDSSRVRQAVLTHVVLKRAVIEELCARGLSKEQTAKLEEALAVQKSKTKKDDIMDMVEADLNIYYLLSAFCKKEYIWDMFRSVDCDLLRIYYLQYSTFNYKVYMSSLTSWEHNQVESRMLIDNIKKRDVEAALLICSNHFNSILWNMDTLRGIYPQFFAE